MEKMKDLYAQYNCDLNDAEVKKAVAEILAKNFAKNNTVEVYKKCFNLIDLTSLNSTDTEDQIGTMMQKVNDFSEHYPEMPNVAAVCVYPSLVPVTRAVLEKENGVNNTTTLRKSKKRQSPLCRRGSICIKVFLR